MNDDSLEQRERRVRESLDSQVRDVDDQVREFLGVPEEDDSSPRVNWTATDLDGLNGFYRWYYAEADDADQITIGRDHEVDTLFHELIHYHGDIQESNELEQRWHVQGLEEGLTELLADEYYGRDVVRCKHGREMAESLLAGLEENGYSHEEAIALLANLHQDLSILPTVMEAAGLTSLMSTMNTSSSKSGQASDGDDELLEDIDDQEDEDEDDEQDTEEDIEDDLQEEDDTDLSRGEDLDQDDEIDLLDPNAEESRDEDEAEDDEWLDLDGQDHDIEDDDTDPEDEYAEPDDEYAEDNYTEDDYFEADEVESVWELPGEDDGAAEEEVYSGVEDDAVGDYDDGYNRSYDSGGSNDG